ncbi:DUF2231 domain-containing protein [Parvularcula oceani]|uniref:DUF2231 domain-containing protein n=1 Tax=Parvularcula oceani TaxID=1247963 RepID=UPI0006920FA3|nr:DUF2231 domain-containing protein [Parvularcula oceani]
MTLDLIEPNIHPVLVHFAYALTVVAAGLYGLALLPRFRQRPGLSAAADWSLFLAGVSVILTIAAGFQAYYSVAHDGPSHEAMTTHRNWAVPTGTLVVLLAAWRWWRRARRPSTALSSGVIVSAALLSVTAWWGGHLVYSYGLGVESLPEAGSGDGHDHDHGEGTTSGVESDGHPHGEDADPGHHDDEGAAGSGVDGHSHDDEPLGAAEATQPATVDVDRSSPEAAAESLAAAYAAGDEVALRSVLSEGLLVAEGGGVEDGLAAYASHHMGSDLAASTTRKMQRTGRFVRSLGEEAALVLTTFEVTTVARDEARSLVETAVMEETPDGWLVTHLHWSFGTPALSSTKEAGSMADEPTPHGEPGHAH